MEFTQKALCTPILNTQSLTMRCANKCLSPFGVDNKLGCKPWVPSPPCLVSNFSGKKKNSEGATLRNWTALKVKQGAKPEFCITYQIILAWRQRSPQLVKPLDLIIWLWKYRTLRSKTASLMEAEARRTATKHLACYLPHQQRQRLQERTVKIKQHKPPKECSPESRMNHRQPKLISPTTLQAKGPRSQPWEVLVVSTECLRLEQPEMQSQLPCSQRNFKTHFHECRQDLTGETRSCLIIHIQS